MPSTATPDRMGAGPIAAYLTLCAVWGSTFLAIRIAVETVPPWTMVGLRCLIAGAALTAIGLAGGATLPRGRAAASAAISGVLLFTGSQAMLSWSELMVPSGEAAILVCTVALLTPIISWLMGASARPTARAGAGLVVGFAGVAVLMRPDPASSGVHAAASLMVLAGSLAWAIGASLARLVPPARSALLGSGLQMLAGALGCAVVAAARGEFATLQPHAISLRSALALAYLVVMGSLVAFACFGWLVQIWRPERLSTYSLVNPLVALLLGAAFAHEPIGPRQLWATALILCAVALAMSSGQRRTSAARPTLATAPPAET